MGEVDRVIRVVRVTRVTRVITVWARWVVEPPEESLMNTCLHKNTTHNCIEKNT